MFVACSASAKHSPLLCCFAAYSTIKPVSCRSAEQMFAQNLAHNAGSTTAALCAHSQGSLFPRRVVPRLPAHLHAHRTSRQVTTVAAAATAPSPLLRKIPKSLSEIDNGKILGFGADLAVDHPGFGDEAYKQRRVSISELARDHQIGEPIHQIQYTADEIKTWGTVLRELIQLYPQHACREFQRNFPMFNFQEDEVPQLEDMSRILKNTTGWQIRPVAGLLHPRDFLNGLAFRTFHSTQYVRHHSQPMYTPEPDICHELLGHVPMLADPAYCDLVQNIGVASLGADEKQIWHLTKLYWFTVEFGVVREEGQIKGFGAGVLSSFGELQHMASGKAKMVDFDPFAPQPKMSYKDGYQKQYFVLNSFQEGAKQLLDYCLSITDPEIVKQHLKNLDVPL